ncbi:TniB family NTP-binding protein [Rhizobacter sp. Root16D2]|uniref:TniB family NTP-binding protein n=1 Tax=Rhizobacter sp. Root16D2 TaxID=1736479 RepID=UPI0006FD3DF0|nr:TniB family NTP-binding protein [Rhizobacter sp. Root16D2]KRB24776.1 hypothetical protein ASE08_00830 [Rhizobacter sp. Root16D2]
MTTTADTAVVVKKLRRFFGHFPQVLEILARLRQLMSYRCVDEEPEHIMLLGNPGTGKSTLLKWFAKQFPRIEHDELTEIPVLYAEVPSNCSIKKLAGVLLRALGSPFWNKGDEEERTFQLQTLLMNCRVRLIILDEINHVVDRGREKSHETVADWIKQQSAHARVSFVLAGIGRSRLLLDANDQFADRFREVLEITPLGLEDEAKKAELVAVMEAFEAMLEGIDHINLQTDDVLRILVFATAGRLRNIRRLLVRSVELAHQSDDKPRIDLSVLEKAFLETIFKHASPLQNPFSSKFRGTPLINAGEPFAPSGR